MPNFTKPSINMPPVEFDPFEVLTPNHPPAAASVPLFDRLQAKVEDK